jgi:hypothetical protein
MKKYVIATHQNLVIKVAILNLVAPMDVDIDSFFKDIDLFLNTWLNHENPT